MGNSVISGWDSVGYRKKFTSYKNRKSISKSPTDKTSGLPRKFEFKFWRKKHEKKIIRKKEF